MQTEPLIYQSEDGRWFVCSNWHKPGHPKRKHDITKQIQAIGAAFIEAFIKDVEKKAAEADLQSPDPAAE